MITSSDKALITGLIKQYAAKASTERMIAYIGDNNGMLSACKLLVEKNNEDDREAMAWVDEQCYDVQVDVRNFLFEISRILAMFQPGQESDPNFNILGLDVGADRAEIKQAYRKLSLQCHPDTATSDNSDDTEEFVRITQAYQALLKDGKDGKDENDEELPVMPHVSPTHWRQQQKSTVSKERKKKSIIWFLLLAGLMIILSLFAANNYRQKAMLVGLQSSRSAFIPPTSSTKESEEVKEPVNVLEKREKIKEQEENDENWEEPKTQSEKSQRTLISIEPSPITLEDDLQKEEEPEQPEVLTAIKGPEDLPPTDLESSGESQEEETSQQSPVQQEQEQEIESEKDSWPPASLNQETVTISPQALKKTVPPIVSIEPKNKKNPPPSPEERKRDSQKRIDAFLAAYTNSYQEKDLLSFTRFFDLKATENDKPLGEIMPTYIQLFQDADQISLAISILKWEKNQEKIIINGRFKIRIHYKNSKQVQGKGEIRFVLADVQQKFLIKELHYQFDQH